MKIFPRILYMLGPQAKSHLGSSIAPHYVFLDAAAIDNLYKVFPVEPSHRQAALLSSLFRSTDGRPVIIVTTPVELMILDHIKETPEKGKDIKPKIKDLVNLGYGNLVVLSYSLMRTEWYLYQPFLLSDLDVTPFKFGGSSIDIMIDTPNPRQERPLMLSPEIHRMKVRIDGFSECARLLKSYLPDCTMQFALLGIRMVKPEIQPFIDQKLGHLGGIHTGCINLFNMFSRIVSPSAAVSAYATPLTHPHNAQTTFTRPPPDLGALRMDIRSIPRFPLAKRIDASPGKIIYLAFDTNAHSRLHGSLTDLTSRFGPNIRLISLPTVAQELARGQGHEARERSLRSFLASGRSKAKRIDNLQFRPAPSMSFEGAVSREVMKADVRIRSEITLVMRQLAIHNPAREVTLAFVTFDVGCHLLCGSIHSGGVRFLLPKVDKRDIRKAGQVIVNVLHPHLA